MSDEQISKMDVASWVMLLQSDISFADPADATRTLWFGVVNDDLPIDFGHDILAFHQDMEIKPRIVLGCRLIHFHHIPQTAGSHWITMRAVDLDFVPVEKPSAIMMLDVKIDPGVSAAIDLHFRFHLEILKLVLHKIKVASRPLAYNLSIFDRPTVRALIGFPSA